MITIQKKAWMDTVGACMWYDLSIGPHYKRKCGKALNVWDNCGPHGVPAVQKVAAEWGIEQAPLPKKMTDHHLHVMDLVANGLYTLLTYTAQLHSRSPCSRLGINVISRCESAQPKETHTHTQAEVGDGGGFASV